MKGPEMKNFIASLIIFGFASSPIYSDASVPCANIVNSAVVKVSESDTFISMIQESQNEIRIFNTGSSQDALKELESNGLNGQPLDSGLVKSVDEAVRLYNKSMFDVYTQDSKTAEAAITVALRNSEEFANLPRKDLENIVVFIASRGRNSQTAVFSTAHSLYLTQVQFKLVEPLNRAKTLLARLQHNSVVLSNLANEVLILDKFKGNPDLKDLKSEPEVTSLHVELTKKMEDSASTVLTPEITHVWLSAAQKYRAGLHQSDAITEMMDLFAAKEAFKSLKEFQRENYCLNLPNIERLGNIVSLISNRNPEILPVEAVLLMKRIGELEDYIRFLQRYQL
jgi:hypothetical protein